MYRTKFIFVEEVIKPMFLEKVKRIKYKKLGELMVAPSAIMFVLSIISFILAFKRPNSLHEEAVIARPMFFYLSGFLAFPFSCCFIYMIYDMLSDIFSSVNIKRWFREVKDALNGL